MPVSYVPQKTTKKKHRSFFGNITHTIAKDVSGTSKGLYKGVTGFPTGVYMLGRGLGHDLLHPASFGHGRTDQMAKAIAHNEVDAYRHFGAGGDFSTPLLDALAALSGGGALVSKGATLGKAVRAGEGTTGAYRGIVASKPFSRQIPGKPYSIPASPNPLARGVQKLVLKNPTVKKRAISRRQWQIDRFQKLLEDPNAMVVKTSELPSGRKVTTTMPKKAPQGPRSITVGKKVLDAPMNALRIAMWARLPRFIGQNAFQSASMFASRPASSADAIVRAASLRKTHPELFKDFKMLAQGGEARAMQEGTLSKGKFMNTLGKMANFPQDQMRVASILEEMKREGIASPVQLKSAIKQLRLGKPSSKVLNSTIRGHENLGDFGRLGKWERGFTKSQIPIFYPMFKALTRYGYRLPFEHSIQSAAGIKVGQQGKVEQKRLLGDLPFWGQYLIPRGAGDPNAKSGPNQATFNPGNIYNLQPAVDISRQAVSPSRSHGSIPGLNLLQEIGPAPQIAGGVLTGHDIQTGYPLRYMSKKGIQHNYTKTQIEAAVRNFVESLPLADVVRLSAGGKPPLKSFEQSSPVKRILLEMFGPSVVSRTLKTAETQKQAKSEVSYGHGRKKTKSHKNTFAPGP